MKKAVVLLSSGLDSLTNTAIAISKGYELYALTFDYGQQPAFKEKENSQKIAEFYGFKHKVIIIDWLKDITNTTLVKGDVPDYDDSKLDDLNYAKETAKKVWVPNRNGLFINIAAAFAESLNYDEIIVGFNIEEAATFPDNSQEFIDASNHSLSYSTANGVKIRCFTTKMNKTQIAQTAKELNVPLNNLCWPCYKNYDYLCGECESCKRYIRATKDL